MTRVPEIGAVASLFALAIALPIWSMTSTTPSLAHQEGDLAPVEVGAGPIREQSLGFTGRNLYSGESVELFGYLTAVIGFCAAVAGVFGMNFETGFFKSGDFGFYFTIAMLFAIIIVSAIIARWQKWL